MRNSMASVIIGILAISFFAGCVMWGDLEWESSDSAIDYYDQLQATWGYHYITVTDEYGQIVENASIAVRVADTQNWLQADFFETDTPGQYTIFSSEFYPLMEETGEIDLEVYISGEGITESMWTYTFAYVDPCCQNEVYMKEGYDKITIDYTEEPEPPEEECPCSDPIDKTECLNRTTAAFLSLYNEDGLPIENAQLTIFDQETQSYLEVEPCNCDPGVYVFYRLPETIGDRFISLEVTVEHPGYVERVEPYYVSISDPECSTCPQSIEHVFGELELILEARECPDPYIEQLIYIHDDNGDLIDDATIEIEHAVTGETIVPVDLTPNEPGYYTIFTDNELDYITTEYNPLLIYVTIRKTEYEIVIREYQFTAIEPTPEQCFQHISMVAGNVDVALSYNNNMD